MVGREVAPGMGDKCSAVSIETVKKLLTEKLGGGDNIKWDRREVSREGETSTE
jgi:hypothetical protein